MSNLTSPVTGSIALPATVALPSVLAPGVPSLAAFIDLMIGKIGPPAAKAAPGDPDRQDDAAPGNSLPDKDKPQVDPALAWLFGAPRIPPAQPIANKAPEPVTTPVIGIVAPEAPPIVAVPLVPTAPVGKDMPSPITPQVETPPTPMDPVILPNKPDVSPPLNQPKPVAPTMTPLPSVGPSQPVAPPMTPLPPLAPSAVTLPALFALPMTSTPEARDDDAPATLAPLAAAIHAADTTASIAPTGDAQRQTLDLGRQDWPQKMIDHIEALRDNANANDTSIRLKPEALGRVDVSLKTHTDGAVSVRFAAEQPATRALLVDAAPQLAAAAEARGIRLSGTSVDLSGQGEHRPRPEVERQQNITNHRAAPRGEDNQAADDGRIA
ncbi:MAG: hypothetical protein E7773_00430 [Sphingomonas sp.]|uniref:flagellar hook-length control protein FliK n=1 Tax=Sphingomonas sp. TaxID=28214 RepID=UPI00120519EB|nr:flagellar hook-length control protein FliK [Sphingomonas sp.]THD38258.1 MAG: hypothetical protein E7773_00430 [Sphingomonas sp.]